MINGQRIVISMTTIPSRLNSIELKNVITSLLNQSLKPDIIYLTLPLFCKKLNSKYPDPSPFIKQNCKLVYIDKDYGPILKLYGAIKNEKDDNTIIITCDDDIICSKYKIQGLVNKSLNFPKAAICSRGFIIGKFPFNFSFVREDNNFSIRTNNKSPIKVDILFGYCLASYRRCFFPDVNNFISIMEKAYNNESLFFNDDVYISALLNYNRIPILAFTIPDIINDTGPDAISGNMILFIKRFILSIRECYKLGLWKEFSDIKGKDRIKTLSFLIIVILLIYLISSKLHI